MSKTALKRELLAAANDEAGGVLRREVVRAVTAGLERDGQRLEFHHWLGGSAAGYGFALAVRMAGQLCAGAALAFDAGLAYAGAGSTRQLLELTYLLSLMAHDETEAEAWAKATRGEILGRFMPRHVRQRTPRSFRPEQYATHCDRGGHPNPAGADLVQLRLGSSQLEGLWADLAQHAGETWDEFCLGLTRYDPRRQVGNQLYSPWRSPEEGAAVADALARWRSEDPLLQVQVMPPGS